MLACGRCVVCVIAVEPAPDGVWFVSCCHPPQVANRHTLCNLTLLLFFGCKYSHLATPLGQTARSSVELFLFACVRRRVAGAGAGAASA